MVEQRNSLNACYLCVLLSSGSMFFFVLPQKRTKKAVPHLREPIAPRAKGARLRGMCLATAPARLSFPSCYVRPTHWFRQFARKRSPTCVYTIGHLLGAEGVLLKISYRLSMSKRYYLVVVSVSVLRTCLIFLPLYCLCLLNVLCTFCGRVDVFFTVVSSFTTVFFSWAFVVTLNAANVINRIAFFIFQLILRYCLQNRASFSVVLALPLFWNFSYFFQMKWAMSAGLDARVVFTQPLSLF